MSACSEPLQFSNKKTARGHQSYELVLGGLIPNCSLAPLGNFPRRYYFTRNRDRYKAGFSSNAAAT
ncbi:hypothetical protein [Aneurinibacillus aneurinilyticus]|uniref:hypothetical protein n=1 Tax=Aneurinibacillus aneurinilyticus TaxID=1391 RepID=UPI0011DE4B16|nr:hypothetical protein [Aneurinibacillus aneurinilyticus]MCI1693695.1 hypothetical protein [Aneurinibacillus aneurinilyticus]MED0671014.1 hypothetical protein [Aneurinibacillus aneurinilyticus]MED0704767.1 hypothetical protein [Aneurinibacillus aneurinilyticus]MED0722630.1 hypothetical protein [Aneurinibacillus aneurinilyticus]MED0730879.1 hypothetical protein [Aneurinibacillus aneurinilyticus]